MWRGTRNVGEYVKDEPLTALAIASVAGFVLGGGVNRRIGLAMLTTVGRIVLRGVATSLIVGMVTGSHDNRRRTAQDLAVEDMTTEEQISKNQDERDEARQNLRDTLTEVNAKVERAGGDLRPGPSCREPSRCCLLCGGRSGLSPRRKRQIVAGPGQS